MKILNFGSLNIDYVYEVEHFARAGETLDSLKLDVFCGGKGLNQSIALSRSGAYVWHAGAVGENDSDRLIEILESSGVNTEYIRKKPGASGHAIIQRDLSGQNSILLYGGANQRITREEIDETLMHFDKGDFIILQNEINETGYIINEAHRKEMNIVFNPSPINEKIFSYPLDLVDYLLLNEVEAMEICKVSGSGDEMIEKLGNLFNETKVVLTLGEKGSIYRDKEQILHQSIYKVKPLDTTAAGDTFTGFFIGSIIRGEKIEKALDNASKASAIAVTRLGAGQSIPSMEEVLNFKL